MKPGSPLDNLIWSAATAAFVIFIWLSYACAYETGYGFGQSLGMQQTALPPQPFVVINPAAPVTAQRRTR